MFVSNVSYIKRPARFSPFCSSLYLNYLHII